MSVGMVWVAVAAGLAALAVKAQAQDVEPVSASATARSLVSVGDTARIRKVMARAQKGEAITVGVIGGSITAGAMASKPELNYGSRVADWWRKAYPKSKVTFVNAGIGATGSNFGALRAWRDLLSKKPDFVVVEYGVNDGDAQEYAESLEGLVRQILRQPQEPAVVLLFMMNNAGGNAQAWHSKVGTHYGLPMVSMRDALWPEIQAGRLKWTDVEADMVHPNDRGHGLSAGFVGYLLDQVKASRARTRTKPIPQPLYGTRYDHVTLLEAADLKPVANTGWEMSAQDGWWHSDKPGSAIEFEVEAESLLAMDFHLNGPMGAARITVDGGTAIEHDTWFDQTWGGWRHTHEIAHGLSVGKHRVRLEVMPQRHALSSGNEFRLMGLGLLGTHQEKAR